MKVRVEQSQRDEKKIPKTLFQRKLLPAITIHFINVKLELTNEEKVTINQYNLEHLVFDEYDNDLIFLSIIDTYNTASHRPKQYYEPKDDFGFYDRRLKLTLSQLICKDGFTRNFGSFHEATVYIQYLKTKILPQIKQTMEHYSTIDGNQSETFEL